MTTATTQRQPELTGQIVVVIGGSAEIGVETADRARAEGAGILIAAAELGALSRAAFDAAAAVRARAVAGDLPEQMDGHVMVTAVGPAGR
jgi:NAD(P)-dependent dehydrogenase (short-subunit alcohol dehydrogenase family)